MNVKQFAAQAGLSTHTIRYYDKLGLFGTLSRNPSGHRRFAHKDLAWLAFILRLKETGIVLIQMAVYAGFPAALNAIFAAREVFAERRASKG